jgi:1,4-dihydroxy-2-naphthoyl-CoA synthase
MMGRAFTADRLRALGVVNECAPSGQEASEGLATFVEKRKPDLQAG